MTLTRARLAELREAVDTGTISWGETAELDDAFAEIPDADLPEPRENATFSDMLDELEARLPDTFETYAEKDTDGTMVLHIEHASGKKGQVWLEDGTLHWQEVDL